MKEFGIYPRRIFWKKPPSRDDRMNAMVLAFIGVAVCEKGREWRFLRPAYKAKPWITPDLPYGLKWVEE